MSVSAVQQSDPVFSYYFPYCLFLYLPSCSIPGDWIEFPVLYRRPHCSSVLNVIVCIYQPQSPGPSHPPENPKSVLFVKPFLFCR